MYFKVCAACRSNRCTSCSAEPTEWSLQSAVQPESILSEPIQPESVQSTTAPGATTELGARATATGKTKMNNNLKICFKCGRKIFWFAKFQNH